MLLGKQINNQTAFLCYSYFFSLSTDVSPGLTKRQLPFVGGSVLSEKAMGSVLNLALSEALGAESPQYYRRCSLPLQARAYITNKSNWTIASC